MQYDHIILVGKTDGQTESTDRRRDSSTNGGDAHLKIAKLSQELALISMYPASLPSRQPRRSIKTVYFMGMPSQICEENHSLSF